MNIDVKESIFLIIDKLLQVSEEVDDGIVTNKELDDFFSNSIKEVYKILGSDSYEYKKFDSWKNTNFLWTPRTRPGYANCNKKILALIKILEDLSLFKNIEKEVHFKIGEDYKIIRYFSKLFQSAKNEILIIDNYIDNNIFDFIEDIDSNIDFKILTSSSIKPNFKRLYIGYTKRNLIVKSYKRNNHDRYIILDKNNIYLVGASLNGFGKTDFTIKKLDNLEKIKDFYNLWDNSDFILD